LYVHLITDKQTKGLFVFDTVLIRTIIRLTLSGSPDNGPEKDRIENNMSFILYIQVCITRLSYMTITLNNTKGTRCEAGEMLILSRHMNASPFFIGQCCWISFFVVLVNVYYCLSGSVFSFFFMGREGGGRDNILYSYIDIMIFRVLESCFSNVKIIEYLKGCSKGIWICLIQCLKLAWNFILSSVISLVPCFSRQKLLLYIVLL